MRKRENSRRGAVLFGTVTLVILFTLFLLPFTFAQPADSPWPMFRHDARRTGQSPYPGPRTVSLAWSYVTGVWAKSSPSIGSDGRIYIGSGDHNIYALNSSGSLSWSYASGADVESSPAIGSDGRVYIGSEDNRLYALNSVGSLSWSYVGAAYSDSSPAIGSDGRVYIGSRDNRFYALTSNGSLLWSYYTVFNVGRSPAIGFDGTVYFGMVGSQVWALTSMGSFAWSYRAGGGTLSESPAVGSDGRVYVGSWDWKVHALNSTGSLAWTYETGLWIYSSPAISSDEHIYVGSHDDRLYSLNSTGSLSWSYMVGGWVYPSPAIDSDGRVFMGATSNRFYAISSSGSFLWSYMGGSVRYPSFAIGSDGRAYIASYSGVIYSLQPVTPSQTPTGSSPTPTITPTMTETPTVTSTPSITNTPTITSTGTIPTPTPCAWPMFRHDAMHTGRSNYAGPHTASLAWSYVTGDDVLSSAAVGPEGRIYVGSNDNRVYALNSIGSLFWSYITEEPICESSPAISSDGRVHVMSSDDRFYALSLAGSLAWSYRIWGSAESSPSIGSDGSIYVGRGNNICAFNSTGSLQWSFITGNVFISSPVIGSQGLIYGGSWDNRLYAFTSTGTLKWSYWVSSTLSSASIGSDRRIYVGSISGSSIDLGRIYAFNQTGSLSWSYVGQISIATSPAIDSDGRIYITSGAGQIYLLSSTGYFMWSYQTGSYACPTSITIGAAGRIYAGGARQVYAINSDGTLCWAYENGAGFDLDVYSPTIGPEGQIYVGAETNIIYCLQNPTPTPTPNTNLDDFRITDVDDIDGDGEDDLAILKKGAGGDVNLYYYNAPVPYDWTYWDAFSRNPSPLARDFWIIPSGNNVIDMAPVTIDGGEGGLAIIKKDGASDLNLYLYRNLAAGDWTYWDAYSRNPSPAARDFWVIPSGNDALSLATLDVDGGEGLAVLKREGGVDENLYLYTLPAAGDWTYWDAFARNPSPLARDLWIIPSGNNAIDIAAVNISLPPDGARELAVLTRNAGDVNIYYYNALLPGDWTYWDAFARNPSPVARDFWMIPSGNDAVSMTALPKATPGQEELALLKNEPQNDINLYVYETLVPGDWTYWNAYSRNPSALARDFWVIPSP